MIGTTFQKGSVDWQAYAEAAEWANANGATIEDKGDYYEVVELTTPEPTAEEQLAALDSTYETLIADAKQAVMEAKDIYEDEEMEAECREELEALITEYDEKREALTNGN